jgi:hypothetical protein
MQPLREYQAVIKQYGLHCQTLVAVYISRGLTLEDIVSSDIK